MENGTLFQSFEWYLEDQGNYFNDLASKLDELKAIGVTAFWLPPVTKATGTNDPGYGIYDLWDLGEFDQKGSIRTKYGTKKELEKLISEIHKRDLLVYADLVLNHKAGADYSERFMAVEVDEKDRRKAISDPYEIEGWTGFDFKNRGGKYSDFKWNYTHFTGIDYDAGTGKSGIYKIVGDNKGWGKSVSFEKGNYDYLMFSNIDHAHPEVLKEIKNWTTWFMEELDLDGFRFDAVKHIDQNFLRAIIHHIEKNAKENFYLFGEYWQNDAGEIKEFLKALEYGMDLFDVVLHFNFYQASLAGDQYDLRKILDHALVTTHPASAVTFVDNHDSQKGQSLESFVEDWFKEIAYGMILLRKDGYPCIFYGDYYGMRGEEASFAMKDKIGILAKIRKRFAYGDQEDYFVSKNCIGWVRQGNKKHPQKCAVVISNGDRSSIKMLLGKDQAHKKYIDYTGNNKGQVSIDQDGYGDFMVSGGSISVWLEDGMEL